MRASLVPWLALLAGCASSSSQVSKEPFPGARPAGAAPTASAVPEPSATGPGALAMPAPAPSEVASPRAFAARFPRADQCESAARSVMPLSRDKAWEVLRACVDRGGFTVIKRLLDGAWDKELTGKSDASQLLTKVVAQRGGDVYGDLNQLRQRRVPLFGLAPATTNPDLYQGRLLLLRARVDQVKTEKGRTSVTLSEFVLSGQTSYQEGDTREVQRSSGQSRRSGSGSLDIKTSRHGNASVRSRYDADASHSSSSTHGVETRRSDNTPVESGLMAVGRVPGPDPFFEPGRQFVILARFDGVREVPTESEEAEVERMPIVTVLSYAEPSPVIVE